MRKRSHLPFDPDYARAMMDLRAKQRLAAIILIIVGSIGLGLMWGWLALAGVTP